MTVSLRATYEAQIARAGGRWCAHVAPISGEPVILHDPDRVVRGYSVQKLMVAVAVLDKVDRGELELAHTYHLTEDLILGGSGIYLLQPVWGDRITVANALTAMLLVSDNTAVRICGLAVPSAEINAILAAKGLARTRVEPTDNPHRFFLGTTTPRETHDLLARLALGTLLSPASSAFLLRVLRWIDGYHDGVRRDMSSAERSRVAAKHGADFDASGAARHEVGVLYAADGSPASTFAFFADRLGDRGNYGATHPAVEAHAVLGRAMLDATP